MTNTNQTSSTTQQSALSLWAVYFICLLISTIFFFLFGFNSPIFTFNSDWDYQWFMTMGHGLLAGRLPYRDLFEQKGPVVYFVTAFCCLFPKPNIMMLMLEIISMSLFFFFAYRIATKWLHQFYALILIPILAFAIFTSWCPMNRASAIEEFCLPIYTYFLLSWLEFISEKRSWNWLRALCLGLCFGILIWTKYTLVYFIIVPMITWFVLSLRAKQFHTILINILMMLIGIIIITTPTLIFYAVNHAFDDLFQIYFVVNMTSYGTTSPLSLLKSIGHFFIIGPIITFLFFWGVIRFGIKHWHDNTGKLLLTAFIVNWTLLFFSSKGIVYYFCELFPYAIFGIADLLLFIQNRFTVEHFRRLIYLVVVCVCILICMPFSILTYEWGKNKSNYTPLLVADVIHDYETVTNTQATLFCYKILDFGFYNAAGIVPNNYYFARNFFTENDFPEMYQEYRRYITEQTSDFIITSLETWNQEYDLLSQYYTPYGTNSTYHYHRVYYFFYSDYDFILLHKI